MSDIIARINDDMDEYTRLCRHFQETPQTSTDAYGNSLLDCYGKHAKSLQEKLRKERKANIKAEENEILRRAREIKKRRGLKRR